MTSRSAPSRSHILALVSALTFCVAWWYSPEYAQARYFPPASDPAVEAEPYFESDFVSYTLDEYMHAASITDLPSGGMQAVWFGGTREGARDVNIYSARLEQAQSDWHSNEVLVDRVTTERALGRNIRKLGNPVIGTAPDGKLWMFYVSVSVGGWAGSAINVMTSDDEGKTWSTPKRLITSPFLNISTLVRGRPVFHTDGTIGLPVYHEFLGKFPEYLRIDHEGRVIDKTRMGYGRDSLQPSTVVLSETQAVSLLRYAGEQPGYVLASDTVQTGESWTAPRRTPIPNPNSGLSAIRYSQDQILVALNDLQDGRHRLTLYLADNSLSKWQRIKILEESPDPTGKPVPQDVYRDELSIDFLRSDDDSHPTMLSAYLAALDERTCNEGHCEFSYAYPYLLKARDGRFHLIYSWNKSMIKHITFNKAWLEQNR